MNSSVPLVVKDLTKVFSTGSYFGRSEETFTSVNMISFSLNKGEILGILGPNGAGKTTTIHMLLGITSVSSGTISYFGKDLKTDRSEIMQRVSFASTYMRLVGSLTVHENLVFYAQLYGVVGDEQTKRIEYF
jgi:ABC-2 type transport system ATP-binding protein